MPLQLILSKSVSCYQKITSHYGPQGGEKPEVHCPIDTQEDQVIGEDLGVILGSCRPFRYIDPIHYVEGP